MEIIYASAGSGKTWQLAKRFLTKVILGENIDNIYCLTFTKKATAEIKERILLFATKLIENDEELLKSFELKKITKKEKEYLQLIFLKELKIFTIDSFLFKILQFLDMNNSRKLLSDEELFLIMEQAKYKFALKHIGNKENFEELTNILKNIYISKRSAIVKMLENRGVDEIYELYKYKNLNKENLEIKIKERLKNIPHYICEKLLNNNDEKSIINTFMNSSFVSIYKNLDKNILKELKKSDQEHIENIFLYSKAFLFMEKSNQTLKELFDYFEMFQNEIEIIKNNKNGIDYNDILIQLNTLLKKEEYKSTFEYYIFNNIGHMLVDEYQDTSSFQDFILETIFQELRYGSNNVTEKPTIFLVGDMKQSIYEWRDADSSLFANKAQSLQKESYRIFNGDKTLIEEKIYEAKVIKNTNIHRIQIDNFTRRMHKNLVEELNKKFENSNLIGFSKHDVQRTDFDTPSIYEEIFVTEYETIDSIIELVKGFVNSGKKFKDICILARNNDILNLLEKEIKLREIKGEFYFPTKKDNGGLTESLEVEFLNDLLLSVFSMENSLYLKRFVERIINDNEIVFNHFSNINTSEKISSIIYDINKIKESNISIEDKVMLLIKQFDLYSYMLKIRKNASITVMNRYFEYLLNSILYISNENEFVERILSIKNNKSLNLDINEEMDAVHLLTIHKAKGLEFDTVIWIEKDTFKEMINGINILPNGQIFDFGKNKTERPNGYKEFDIKFNYYKKEEQQSQLRLAYVAFTRAKNNLIILKNQ